MSTLTLVMGDCEVVVRPGGHVEVRKLAAAAVAEPVPERQKRDNPAPDPDRVAKMRKVGATREHTLRGIKDVKPKPKPVQKKKTTRKVEVEASDNGSDSSEDEDSDSSEEEDSDSSEDAASAAALASKSKSKRGGRNKLALKGSAAHKANTRVHNACTFEDGEVIAPAESDYSAILAVAGAPADLDVDALVGGKRLPDTCKFDRDFVNRVCALCLAPATVSTSGVEFNKSNGHYFCEHPTERVLVNKKSRPKVFHLGCAAVLCAMGRWPGF
jgi:hypothetical protein